MSASLGKHTQDSHRFLESWRDRLWFSDEAFFPTCHTAFLHELLRLPDDYFFSLPLLTRLEWATIFTASHQKYLTLTELNGALRLLARAQMDEIGPKDLLECLFGRESGQRMQDLEDAIGADDCQKIVMVGCGPFPATLLWMAHRFPGAQCRGLDSHPESLEMARKVAACLPQADLHFELVCGTGYDYGDADFIYVANQVSPKLQILEQIEKTATKNVTVVVREPCGNGWLLAEGVAAKLPAAFSLRRTGKESPSFLSCDLVLSLAKTRRKGK